MRSIQSFLVVAASASMALADLESRAYKGSEVFSVDFVKRQGENHLSAEASRQRAVKRSLRKRTDPFVATLGNDQLLYYANITIGTPESSPIQLQIDSGSSDVWVESYDSKLCSQTNQCQKTGVFDYSKSSTFKVVDQGAFSISYVDGTSADGDYFTDNLHFGGKTINALQMGIARRTSIPEGIMGIGYDTNEALASNGGGSIYPSLVDQLVSQGFINTKAYSLWLNDLDSNTGSILFGGIDTEKYQGQLSGLPLQTDQGQTKPTEFAVVFAGFGYTNDDGKSTNLDKNKDLPLAAVLDSGSSFTVLPNDLADAAAAALQGTFNEQVGSYIVDCSLENDSKFTFDFQFGNSNGPTIRVPLTELVHPVVQNDGTVVTDSSGKTVCQLGIVPAGELQQASYLFGDSFLRSAYVVYNLDENMVYIAPTVYNTTKSNVLAISKSGVPDVGGTAGGETVTPSGTGYVHGGQPTGKPKSASPRSHQVGLSLLGVSAFVVSYFLI